uniref:DNA topoisomerase n=1 Tax=Thermofilum pendens TaxID=2269 RepID=A0A7J3X6Q5_THEPE
MSAHYSEVIVTEKPTVALAFAKYLSDRGYRTIRVEGVKAFEFRRNGLLSLSIGLRGHVLDYDFPSEYNIWAKVDPRELFFTKPILVVREGAGKYVRALRTIAKRTRRVILALDADPEGEGIAFEVMRIMSFANPELEFKRAWFSAVTPEDLAEAIRKLREPNPNLANKVAARMVLDLTIGAAFTRLLTLSVKDELPRGRFLSYGPCQTPVLYFVVKRALEREQHKQKRYYVVVAELLGDGVRFAASVNLGEDREKAAEVFSRVKSLKTAVVTKSERAVVEVAPPVPLNTVELERRASLYLNIRPKETLDIAERLYQLGYISYPRTDTTIYPPTLNLRKLAGFFVSWEDAGWYVRKILSRELKPTQGREDDKAHPPIHPTRAASREELTKRLGEKAWRVYELVVRHFLATLSEEAELERQKLEVDLGGLKLQAEGRRVLYPGFYYVYPYARPEEVYLPYLVEGDEVEVLKVRLEERKTQPPPYISESELLALMKRYGIGTDATMQDHIHTNVERKYFVVREKRCIPTPLGKALLLSLLETVPQLVMPEVRGRMEAALAAIARGEEEPEDVVRGVLEEFLGYYDQLKSKMPTLSERLREALAEVYGSDGRAKGAVAPEGGAKKQVYKRAGRRGEEGFS